jgi:hypothetical protein
MHANVHSKPRLLLCILGLKLSVGSLSAMVPCHGRLEAAACRSTHQVWFCEGLRTPAPVRAAPPSWGRHPKTFTQGDIVQPELRGGFVLDRVATQSAQERTLTLLG